MATSLTMDASRIRTETDGKERSTNLVDVKNSVHSIIFREKNLLEISLTTSAMGRFVSCSPVLIAFSLIQGDLGQVGFEKWHGS